MPNASALAVPLSRAPALGFACALAVQAAPAASQTAAHASTRPAAVVEGERDLLYHLDWGPVALGEFKVRHVEGAAGRSLAIEARSRGLASVIFDFSLTETTVEDPRGDRRFTMLGEFGKHELDRRVTWEGAAAPSVEHRADPPEPDLTPVPAAELPRSIDPAAAVLAVMDRIEAGKGCAGRWVLYDGVRMNALTVADEGMDRIAADRDWTYAGPARRCRLGLERIGGYPAGEPPKTAEKDFDRLLWVAELDGEPTPVRLQVSWPLGFAIGRIDLR